MTRTLRLTQAPKVLSSCRSSGSPRTFQWLAQHRGFRAAERQNAPCVSVVQQPSYVPVRHLSSSCPLQKRAGKANTAHAKSDSSPPINKAFVPTPTDEAFDYSAIEAKILDAVEKLTHELKQLRAGGRFNPDLLEGLRVSMGKSGAKETFRLGDLAQVVPKGRLINVIVGDKDYIKPVKSAIMASPYSLTPQEPSPDNPLTIPVPLPPPTGESRKAALDTAKKALEKAEKAIHDARAAHQKKLRKFGVDRSVRSDDLHKAGKGMDEVVKKGAAEVKSIYEGAKKVLEQQ